MSEARRSRRAQSPVELLGEKTYDIYLNDVAYWKNIPARVWEYTIGAYQVIKKWLSYREHKLLRIFCEEPPDKDEALEEIPEAVLEVLSKDYEKKDTEIDAPFYLEQGVKDVILFDPRTQEVTARRRNGTKLYKSPVKITLECGCQITV